MEALERSLSPAPFPPRALPPGNGILSETTPSDYQIAMFELWLFPERGGFYSYACFCILIYIFLVRKKRKKEENKLKQY